MKNNSTLDEIFKHIEISNQKQQRQGKLEGVDTKSIAIDLMLDRANTSRYLNILFRQNEIIKIEGRPTLFFSRKILNDIFPNEFIPNSFASNELFQQFVQLKYNPKEENKSKNKIIGIDFGESLYDAYSIFKKSITYPPYGLNIYVSGPVGVGKLHFIQSIFKELLTENFYESSEDLIIIHCQQINDDLLTTLDSVMYKNDHKKMIVLNGINQINHLHFYELVEILSAKLNNSEDYLNLYKKNQFVMISNSDVDNQTHFDLTSLCPSKIYISRFDDKTIREKTLFVLQYLYDEASSIKKVLHIDKETIDLFVMNQYKHNLVQLRSEIKSTILDALLKDSNSEILKVTPFNVSNELSRSTQQKQENTEVQSVIEQLPFDTIIINPFEPFDKIERYFPNRYNITQQPHAIKLSHYCKTLISMNEYFIDKPKSIEHLRIIENYLNQLLITHDLECDQYKKVLSIELSNIVYKFKNNIKQINLIPDFEIDDQNILNFSKSINDFIMKEFSIFLEDKCLIFNLVSHFIYMSKSIIEHSLVQILVVSKSNKTLDSSIALFEVSLSENKDIHQTLNTLLIRDKPIGTSYRQIFDRIIDKCYQIDQGKGVLVLFSEEYPNHIIEQFNLLNQKENFIGQPLTFSSLSEIITKSSNAQNYATDLVKDEDTLLPHSITNVEHINYLKEMITLTSFDENMIFLNPKRVIESCSKIYFNIAQDLSLDFIESRFIRFVVHLGFTIERIKSNDSISYKNLLNFEKDHQHEFLVVEKNLVPLKNEFDITFIPKSEVAYIVEILIVPIN